MKKMQFFMSALVVGAMMFTACKKEDPVVVVPPPTQDSTEVVVEDMPSLADPDAGFVTLAIAVPEGTCNGLYAVGTINSWAEKNFHDFPFTKVEGTETWWQVTLPYAADMQVKVLALPKDTTLVGWSYQWAKNIDPEDPDTTITEDHVILLNQNAELTYENQGQPKLINALNGSVVFIQVKAWASEPCVELGVATEAWIKHPWNGGDWTYQQMVPGAAGTFTYAARFGGNGVNIALDGKGASEVWYPDFEGYANLAAGDSVLFTFVSEKGASGKVSATLIEKGTPVEKNPAGTATFTLTAAPLPEGATVAIVGNINGWDVANPVAMTFADGVYTATADVPEAAEYKYVYKLADAAGYDWDHAENGGNRQMALDLKAIDEVTEWLGLPNE